MQMQRRHLRLTLILTAILSATPHAIARSALPDIDVARCEKQLTPETAHDVIKACSFLTWSDNADSMRLDGLLHRSYAYLFLEQYDLGAEDLTSLLVWRPQDADLWANRAFAYFRLQKFDQSLDDAYHAILLDPNMARAYEIRGNDYAGLGQNQKALDDFGQSLKLRPDNAATYFDRSTVYQSMKQYDLAIADYEKAAASSPSDYRLWNGVCWLHATTNRSLDVALAACDKAVSLSNNGPEMLDSRGFVYFRIGNYAAAISDFSAALAANPKQETSLYVRGLAKLKTGDGSVLI